MAIISNKYPIPVHNHDLTNILSSSQSQKMSSTRKQIVDFNGSEANASEYIYSVKVGNVNVEKKLSFKVSDNLFDDLCIIEKQILDEIHNRENAINDVTIGYQDAIEIVNETHASNDDYGNVKISENGGLSVVDGVLSVDQSLFQMALYDQQSVSESVDSSLINFKTVGGQSLFKKDGDTSNDIDVLTPYNIESTLTDCRVITEANLTTALQTDSITPLFTNLSSQVTNLNNTVFGNQEMELPGLTSIVNQWASAITGVQNNIIRILNELEISDENESSRTTGGNDEYSNYRFVDVSSNYSGISGVISDSHERGGLAWPDSFDESKTTWSNGYNRQIGQIVVIGEDSSGIIQKFADSVNIESIDSTNVINLDGVRVYGTLWKYVLDSDSRVIISDASNCEHDGTLVIFAKTSDKSEWQLIQNSPSGIDLCFRCGTDILIGSRSGLNYNTDCVRVNIIPLEN